MVRLKVRDNGNGSVTILSFQFHYGTIKSIRHHEYNYYNEEFQFHYGTIKSGCGAVAGRLTLISIPLWYD